jgi:hypothetical protein
MLLVRCNQEVNQHLHDSFDHRFIHETARQRHHVNTEVQGLLSITRKMLLQEWN